MHRNFRKTVFFFPAALVPAAEKRPNFVFQLYCRAKFIFQMTRCQKVDVKINGFKHESHPIERRADSEPRENFENLNKTAILETASFKKSFPASWKGRPFFSFPALL